MTVLGLISTPRLRWLQGALARLGVGLGLRVAIANEVWRRDELEALVNEARAEAEERWAA